MREDIAFDAEGATLAGWLYRPDRVEGPVPAIVMAHGFSGVKEQYLDDYAAAFAQAGCAALVFDNRNFGASGGGPRQEIDPIRQVRDYRHAISYARSRPDIDRDRIGVWGTSYSGGHALMVAALDRRVKCVVSQVPTISSSEAGKRLRRSDQIPAFLRALESEREARFGGAAPKMIPVVAENPATPCALPDPEAWDFFQGSAARAPAWRNEITLLSAEFAREYEPGAWIHRISPTPLLMIVADGDLLTFADLALEAHERALQPKRLVLLKGHHFVPYVEQFEQSSSAAAAWFVEHLRPH